MKYLQVGLWKYKNDWIKILKNKILIHIKNVDNLDETLIIHKIVSFDFF